MLAACASPALVQAWAISRFGVNVLFWDQWDPGIAGLFLKAQRGELSLSDFTALHNEHRILVPRVLYLLLGSLSGWNTLLEMWAEWLVVCATSHGVLLLIRRTHAPSPGGRTPWIRTALPWLLCVENGSEGLE